MKTAKYLKENREEIVTILTGIQKGMVGVTLKQLMLAFKSKMEETNNNKTLSYGAARQVEEAAFTMESTYSKPYSQSNHAKMVNYHGSKKANRLMNL